MMKPAFDRRQVRETKGEATRRPWRNHPRTRIEQRREGKTFVSWQACSLVRRTDYWSSTKGRNGLKSVLHLLERIEIRPTFVVCRILKDGTRTIEAKGAGK